MALINIEYGALASSDTMNKNFSYLDNKIAETNESTLTSISSILSNISTINSRMSEITNLVEDSFSTMSSQIEEYKQKTKVLVNTASMVPDWSNITTISITADSIYTAKKNGYVLVVAVNNSAGNLMVNNKTIVFKTRANSYDNVSQLVVIPVNKNDVLTCTMSLTNAYFLPSKEISIENF